MCPSHHIWVTRSHQRRVQGEVGVWLGACFSRVIWVVAVEGAGGRRGREIAHICALSSFSRSVVSDSFTTPWTAARQAPLSMGFSRQEDWSGLPFPAPGDPPDPGIEPVVPALAGGFLSTEPPGRFCLFQAHSRRKCKMKRL